MYKIAHIISAEPDRMTGPKNSVTLLSKAMCEENIVSDVFNVLNAEQFTYNEVVIKSFNLKDLDTYDFVIFSGLYNKEYTNIARYISRKKIPYCISPRSSLMKSSMQKSSLKKWLFLNLYARSFIKKASFIHFLCDEEKGNSLDVNANTFICSNIIKIPKYVEFSNKRKVIGFLGRYDIQHKGLDRFLKAILLCKDEIIQQEFKVVLHGEDYNNGLDYLRKFVESNNLKDVVEINGPLFGSNKDVFFQEVSLFIHTSRYEGMPQSVMESMANGCAIGVTKGSNMYCTATKNSCGFGFEDSPDKIAQTIVMSISNFDTLKEIGWKSYKYASDNYSAGNVARVFLNKIENFVK